MILDSCLLFGLPSKMTYIVSCGALNSTHSPPPCTALSVFQACTGCSIL